MTKVDLTGTTEKFDRNTDPRAMASHSHSHHELEEGTKLMLDWKKLLKVAKTGSMVVPVCVQDFDTKEVLILAYANEEALRVALERRIAVLYSTSRKSLWIKGATSGDYLDLRGIRVNCEQNSLVYLVTPRRYGACHTKDAEGRSRKSCYYRAIKLDDGESLSFIPSSESKAFAPWGAAILAFFLGWSLAVARTRRL